MRIRRITPSYYRPYAKLVKVSRTTFSFTFTASSSWAGQSATANYSSFVNRPSSTSSKNPPPVFIIKLFNAIHANITLLLLFPFRRISSSRYGKRIFSVPILYSTTILACETILLKRFLLAASASSIPVNCLYTGTTWLDTGQALSARMYWGWGVTSNKLVTIFTQLIKNIQIKLNLNRLIHKHTYGTGTLLTICISPLRI